jgi:hypothetical protein
VASFFDIGSAFPDDDNPADPDMAAALRLGGDEGALDVTGFPLVADKPGKGEFAPSLPPESEGDEFGASRASFLTGEGDEDEDEALGGGALARLVAIPFCFRSAPTLRIPWLTGPDADTCFLPFSSLVGIDDGSDRGDKSPPNLDDDDRAGDNCGADDITGVLGLEADSGGEFRFCSRRTAGSMRLRRATWSLGYPRASNAADESSMTFRLSAFE